ncbi:MULTISPECIES: GNAT family N-acetyltransferase [unclassified Rathayibacter]|uniref:GNAT family N-acetyltransferase n=1 Tax=unclassified Rathayibacter TaxID=2609250 RepID=UPI001C6396A1|nr:MULTISPECIES: GNAT family N-acetyltransferase [unclassified Rathayibacter]
MERDFLVRPARPADAEAMALVHVASWRDTYRGTLVSDDVLDAPDLLESRERFWIGALTDERWADIRVAVAEREGVIFGIAMSNPTEGEEWTWHLNVLYVAMEHHGTGAGEALLNAVIDPGEPAALWVGDPVPRAQAFYRKSGFAPTGTVKIEGGIREIRMVRPAS